MTASIHIRAANIDDLEAVNRVISKAVMSWKLPERVKRLSLSSFLYDDADLQHMQLLTASINNNIVGVLALDNEHPDNNMLIHGLFVDPDHQHKGIGTHLFKQAESAARQRHCTGLLVRAHKDAIGFFTAMDMTKVPVSHQQHDYQERYWKQLS